MKVWSGIGTHLGGEGGREGHWHHADIVATPLSSFQPF